VTCGYTDYVLLPLALTLLSLGDAPPRLVVGCSVSGDRDARVYELRRDDSDSAPRWTLVMHSRKAGSAPVFLPLPDAKPRIGSTEFELEYSSLNGGRAVKWTVKPTSASLDVHANFELEVNVEADLDPRVELMNTDGAISNLACEIAPR